jgi:hypothetical protein
LVTFDATAACGASCVTYHWKWEDAAKVLSDVGANSPLLLIEDVDASNVGTYWCEVSYDGLVHPTAPAALSVEERVVILPLDPQTVAEGETCTFSVSATGGYLPLSYAWSKDGSPIPDAHASTYTTLPLEASDSGSVYTVTVADSNGDQQSASVEVTVALGVPAAGVAGMLALFVVLTAVSRRK